MEQVTAKQLATAEQQAIEIEERLVVGLKGKVRCSMRSSVGAAVAEQAGQFVVVLAYDEQSAQFSSRLLDMDGAAVGSPFFAHTARKAAAYVCGAWLDQVTDFSPFAG